MPFLVCFPLQESTGISVLVSQKQNSPANPHSKSWLPNLSNHWLFELSSHWHSLCTAMWAPSESLSYMIPGELFHSLWFSSRDLSPSSWCSLIKMTQNIALEGGGNSTQLAANSYCVCLCSIYSRGAHYFSCPNLLFKSGQRESTH